jgi:hypothetical protein
MGIASCPNHKAVVDGMDSACCRKPLRDSIREEVPQQALHAPFLQRESHQLTN